MKKSLTLNTLQKISDCDSVNQDALKKWLSDNSDLVNSVDSRKHEQLKSDYLFVRWVLDIASEKIDFADKYNNLVEEVLYHELKDTLPMNLSNIASGHLLKKLPLSPENLLDLIASKKSTVTTHKNLGKGREQAVEKRIEEGKKNQAALKKAIKDLFEDDQSAGWKMSKTKAIDVIMQSMGTKKSKGKDVPTYARSVVEKEISKYRNPQKK
jgi:hypothetical protein